MALVLPQRRAALSNQFPAHLDFNSALMVSADSLATAQLMTAAHSTSHFNAATATALPLLLNALVTLTALLPLHSDVPTTCVSLT